MKKAICGVSKQAAMKIFSESRKLKINIVARIQLSKMAKLTG